LIDPLFETQKRKHMLAAEPVTFWSRYRWWLLAGSALAAVAWFVIRSSQPLPVPVAEARGGSAERVLAITGRTRPQVTVTIVPKTAGQIVALAKEEGDSVQAGEVLVRIDAAASRAAVDQVDSALAAQRRTLAEAERNLARSSELKARGLTTAKEHDQAVFELDQARAELGRLAATRREANARLSDATLIAPVSGIVLSRPVDIGQVVSAASTIYEIAPLAGVEIEAEIDERYLSEIKPGLTADVLIAGRAEPLDATIHYIAPRVDPRTGGAKVRLRFTQDVTDLRAGVTADVNLLIEKRADAVTIARSQILGRDTTARALVLRDGRVLEQPIRFIEWPSDRVIVTEGLEAGALVVAQPKAELIGERATPTEQLIAAKPARPIQKL
jgi:RND family efflux transporter MFP subunit